VNSSLDHEIPSTLLVYEEQLCTELMVK
jgi:hypothetical protein